MIDPITREQLKEQYTACDLVEALDLSIDEIIDSFDTVVEDRIEELLDKERGIGL